MDTVVFRTLSASMMRLFGTILAVNWFYKKGSIADACRPKYASGGCKTENYGEVKKFRREIIIYNYLLNMDFFV